MKRFFRRPPLLLLLLLEAACSTMPHTGGYYENDGPGRKPLIGVSHIPDAVPRAEPLSATGNQPYTVLGKTYYPLKSAAGYQERGIASWYGKQFHGKLTSDGEHYNMYAMTAAHKTLPLPSYARVTNLNNGRSVIVRINDRGPFLENRLIDLSYAAAAKLGILATGTGIVEVDGLAPQETTPRTITAEAAVPDPSAPAVESDARTPLLYLQVGAFASRNNAETLRSHLEQADFKAVKVEHAHSSSLYRVRIGPIANVEASDRLAQRIAAYGIHNAYVVVE